MASTFANQITIEVDGTPLSEALEMHLEEVVVDDYLHLPDMFTLTFRDPERTVLGEARVKIGSVVRVSSSESGGTKPGLLIHGEVTAVEAEYTEGGSRITVCGYDPSHRLHRGRLSTSYADMKDSDIAAQVAKRVGLQVGVVDDSGPVEKYVAQANLTDWEFLSSRAREIGFEISVEEGKLNYRDAKRSTSAPPDGDYDSSDPLQLVFGKELVEFHPRLTSAGQVKEVVVRGWDPATKQALVGRAPAAASSATLKAKPADLAALFGDPTHVSGDLPLSSQAAVDAGAKALSEQIGSAHAEASGVALGHPKLRPGTAVKISVVDEHFEGAYVITQARHIFNQAGYRTWFTISGRQDRSILGLTTRTGGGQKRDRINGVVVGLVTQNDDRLGRVKLKFPWMSDSFETDWARVASLGAGARSGAVWLPQVDDEVLVAFEHGDFRRPYVLGGLWNGIDKPPLGDGLFDNGSVKRRGFVSRKGHRFVFLDGDGDAGIALLTSNDSLRIALKESATEIHVASDGTIVIESKGDLKIKGDANVTIEAGTGLTLKGATVTIKGSGPVDIDGSPIQLN
jgi:phage protein D/phage baseplate assembly protein gpV